GREQIGNRQPRRSGARYAPEGIHGEIGAALHVVDAGTVESIAVAAARRGFERAERMHGIKVGKHEDTAAVLVRARGECVAELRRAGRTLEADRNVAQIRRDTVDHAIDSRNVSGWALDTDPALDPFDHCAEVDRIVA